MLAERLKCLKKKDFFLHKNSAYEEKVEANDVCLFTHCKRTIQGPPCSCGDGAFGDINVLAVVLGWDTAASGKTYWSHPRLFFYFQVFSISPANLQMIIVETGLLTKL